MTVKIVIYTHGGQPSRGIAGDDASCSTARRWEDLYRLLQADPVELVILDSVPATLRRDLTSRIKTIKQVPVVYFTDNAIDKLMTAAEPAAPSAPAAGDPLERARRFMDENFRRQLSLHEIAAQAGVSAGYFCRRFKNRYGIPPIMYLRNLRLAHASHLLIHTSLPLAGVTEQSGFFSISYFCREFHKGKGQAPIAFRKQYSPRKP